MAKRQTEESRIVNFFTYAPLETARVVLGIATGVFKQRLAAENGEGPRKTATKRKTKARPNSVGRGAEQAERPEAVAN